jgi:hypothetical protein
MAVTLYSHRTSRHLQPENAPWYGDKGLRVFENRVLRSTFGMKRNEVMGGWRKLHNKELHDLYCSPSIIRMIMLRRMRWVRHPA